MAKISELKEIIVDLKLDLVNASIPFGHCPYAYYSPTTQKDIDCNEFDCDLCREVFMKNMEKDIRKEVRSL